MLTGIGATVSSYSIPVSVKPRLSVLSMLSKAATAPSFPVGAEATRPAPRGTSTPRATTIQPAATPLDPSSLFPAENLRGVSSPEAFSGTDVVGAIPPEATKLETPAAVASTEMSTPAMRGDISPATLSYAQSPTQAFQQAPRTPTQQLAAVPGREETPRAVEQIRTPPPSEKTLVETPATGAGTPPRGTMTPTLVESPAAGFGPGSTQVVQTPGGGQQTPGTAGRILAQGGRPETGTTKPVPEGGMIVPPGEAQPSALKRPLLSRIAEGVKRMFGGRQAQGTPESAPSGLKRSPLGAFMAGYRGTVPRKAEETLPEPATPPTAAPPAATPPTATPPVTTPPAPGSPRQPMMQAPGSGPPPVADIAPVPVGSQGRSFADLSPEERRAQSAAVSDKYGFRKEKMPLGQDPQDAFWDAARLASGKPSVEELSQEGESTVPKKRGVGVQPVGGASGAPQESVRPQMQAPGSGASQKTQFPGGPPGTSPPWGAPSSPPVEGGEGFFSDLEREFSGTPATSGTSQKTQFPGGPPGTRSFWESPSVGSPSSTGTPPPPPPGGGAGTAPGTPGAKESIPGTTAGGSTGSATGTSSSEGESTSPATPSANGVGKGMFLVTPGSIGLYKGPLGEMFNQGSSFVTTLRSGQMPSVPTLKTQKELEAEEKGRKARVSQYEADKKAEKDPNTSTEVDTAGTGGSTGTTGTGDSTGTTGTGGSTGTTGTGDSTGTTGTGGSTGTTGTGGSTGTTGTGGISTTKSLLEKIVSRSYLKEDGMGKSLIIGPGIGMGMGRRGREDDPSEFMGTPYHAKAKEIAAKEYRLKADLNDAPFGKFEIGEDGKLKEDPARKKRQDIHDKLNKVRSEWMLLHADCLEHCSKQMRKEDKTQKSLNKSFFGPIPLESAAENINLRKMLGVFMGSPLYAEAAECLAKQKELAAQAWELPQVEWKAGMCIDPAKDKREKIYREQRKHDAKFLRLTAKLLREWAKEHKKALKMEKGSTLSADRYDFIVKSILEYGESLYDKLGIFEDSDHYPEALECLAKEFEIRAKMKELRSPDFSAGIMVDPDKKQREKFRKDLKDCESKWLRLQAKVLKERSNDFKKYSKMNKGPDPEESENSKRKPQPAGKKQEVTPPRPEAKMSPRPAPPVLIHDDPSATRVSKSCIQMAAELEGFMEALHSRRKTQ